MPLARWSARRLVIVWMLGLTLQTLVVILPLAAAGRHTDRSSAAQQRQWAGFAERQRVAERVNDAWAHAERARAGNASPRAAVRMGARGPAPAQWAASETRWRYFGWVVLGAVPLSLVVLTAAWMWMRRRLSPRLSAADA